MENQIVEVRLTLNKETGKWAVAVTKEFAPDNGGGSQVFIEDGGVGVHYALDTARGMVTLSPGQRTDVPRHVCPALKGWPTTVGSGLCGCCGDDVRAGGCS